MSTAILYDHVEQKCTKEQIVELLRAIKGRSDAANRACAVVGTKADNVRSLRIAVEERFAEIDEVLELLRRNEETGHQHILLLRPATELEGKAVPMQEEEVFNRLFDGGKPAFPRFEYPSSGFVWVDFRPVRAAEGDWIAKAYGRELYQTVAETITEDLGNGRVQETKVYESREVSAILVVRWRANLGILELRIDVSGVQNSQTVPDRRAALWRLLEPAMTRDNFIGLDVSGLMRNLVFARQDEANQAAYSISRIELMDSRSGSIRVFPFQSEQLDNEPGRAAALRVMEEADFQPSLVRVDWKLTDDPKDVVSTVLEKTENGPELRILRKLTAEMYENVFAQLQSRL